MPVLACTFYWSGFHQLRFWSKVLLLALFFSFLGDVLLMMVENNAAGELYFLLGLTSFLLGHLCYILTFVNFPTASWSNLYRKPLRALPFVLFLTLMLSYLWPLLPPAMQLPVGLYALVITLMGISSLLMRDKASKRSARLVLIGALLFILSDSLIALNKFVSELTLWQPRLLIMTTYIAGQYLIVRGMVMAFGALES